MFILRRKVFLQVAESLWGNKGNSTSETFECRFLSPGALLPSHLPINTHFNISNVPAITLVKNKEYNSK